MPTYYKKPAADGYYEQWNGPGNPTDAYTAVDDSTSPTGHDGDTTLLTDEAVAGNRISFTLEAWDVPEGETITAITVHTVIRMGTGTGSFKPFTRLSSTDGDGTQVNLSGYSYVAYSESLACPSGAWSDLTSLSGLEIGCQCLNGVGKLIQIRLTQIYVEITTAEDETEGTVRGAHSLNLALSKAAKLASRMIAEKYNKRPLVQKLDTTLAGHVRRLSNSVPFAAYDPPWWDSNYYRRAPLNHGLDHSEYPAGYSDSFNLMTGYAVKVATNQLVNEGWPWIGKDDEGNTYMAWLGYPTGVAGTCHIWIKKYTYSTGTWSAAVDVVDSGAAYDTHYSPVGLIDKAGYIHLFYGAHNSQMKYSRSTNIKDITAWNSPGTIGLAGSGSSYPKAVCTSNGDIYMFCREYQSGKSKYVYYKSTNNGVSWGTIVPVVDYTSNYGGNSSIYCYGVRVDSSDRMHIVFTFWDYYLTDNKARAVAYCYSNAEDGYDRWYEADGSYIVRLSTEHPIYYADIAKVATSPNFPTAGPYYGDQGETLCIDEATQYPYLAFIAAEGGDSHTGDLMFAKWTGSAWSSQNLGDLVGAPTLLSTRFVQAAVYLQNQTIYIYGQVLPAGAEEAFGGEIFRWRGTDYGTSWSQDYYTMNSGYGWGGVMGLLGNIADDHFRELAWGRGEDIYWLEDRQYTMVRNDGADVRVVLQRLGQADIELNRLPDQWQTNESKIDFKINTAGVVPTDRAYPHAYARYMVYWAKYNASNPPRDPNNVHLFYDSFESLTSGDDLTLSADWTGDSGVFTVCEAGDVAVHAAAHTNKLWSGKNFIFATDDGAKYNSHAIALDNHYLEFHICTGGDLAAGDKGYLELYDSISTKYVRFGLNNDVFAYLKSGGSWVDTAQGADGLRYHTVRILINSSGVSFWGDGVSLLTNDNHITSCTEIRLGYDIAANANPSLLYMDDVKIDMAIANPGATVHETQEGTTETGFAHLSNLPRLQQISTTRIAHAHDLQKERRQRLAAKLADGDRSTILRLMAMLDPDKLNYTELASVIGNLDKTSLADLAGRLGQADKTRLLRIVAKLGNLQRVSMLRAMQQLGAEEKTELIRLASTIAGEWTAAKKTANDINLDRQALADLAGLLAGDKNQAIREGHKLAGDVTQTQRVMNAAARDKVLTQRVNGILDRNKTSIAKLASDTGLDKHTLIRLLCIAVADRTDLYRLAAKLDLQYTDVLKEAHNFGKNKELTARLGHIADVRPINIVRLSEIFSGLKTNLEREGQSVVPDKQTVEHLAHWLVRQKQLKASIAGALGLDKNNPIEIAHAILTDKNLAVRMPHYLPGYKTITERLNSYLTYEREVCERVGCYTDLLASGFVKIGGCLGLEKHERTELANLVDFSGQYNLRLCHALSADRITSVRVPGYVALQKVVYIRAAQNFGKNKQLLTRLSGLMSLDATEDIRLGQAMATDKIAYERVCNALACQYMQDVSISNLVGLVKTSVSRLANRLPFDIRILKPFDLINLIMTAPQLTEITTASPKLTAKIDGFNFTLERS